MSSSARSPTSLSQVLAGVVPVLAGANDPFGQLINPVRKHVFTTTLSGELPWNRTVIDCDPVEQVKNLHVQGGGDLCVVGGIETVRLLFLTGIIDQLILTTHPVVTTVGRRLFDESVPVTRVSSSSAK